MNALVNGPLDPFAGGRLPSFAAERLRWGRRRGTFMKIPRDAYANLYGPTTGDRVRLADTDLFLEIERDFAIYGEEVTFGGGKVIRDGQGQSQTTRADGAPDLVITNAIVLDYWGVVKADVGVRDGRICAIGKAGNPDIQDTRHAGAGDRAVHRDHRRRAPDPHRRRHRRAHPLHQPAAGAGSALQRGDHDDRRRHRTGRGHARDDLFARRVEHPPDDRGDAEPADELRLPRQGQRVDARRRSSSRCGPGAMGLKLHEDWGTTPAAIDTALTVADEHDVQVAIHTDTLNESGFVDNTIAAFKGRTIHTYHSEGAGGGHAPDIMRVCAEPNVLPSSTNPTMPYTVNTLDEHLDMLIVCHHLNSQVPEDVAFAESRIRPETMAAEDVLHDLGAISMMSSDSQAMGRVGEVIARTWQTAHVMKGSRGALPGDSSRGDNLRIRRYLAKYTINPARAHGISDYVGSIEVGKIADLVLWSPAFFGVKPDLVLKGGVIAGAAMGDPNASIPTPEPVRYRPMFAAFGRAAATTSWTFVSGASLDGGRLPANLDRTLLPVTQHAPHRQEGHGAQRRAARRSRSIRSATR